VNCGISPLLSQTSASKKKPSLIDAIQPDRISGPYGKRFLLAHRNDPATPDLRGLSPRERQVLAYFAFGHSDKAIAYELGLAPSTIATHLAHARAKLGPMLRTALRTLRYGKLA
jgi:DNA-binding CsgD family transcriptional regulator